MKLLCLVLTLALGLAWTWPLSAVQAESVIVANQTGRPIQAIYLAPAGTNDWTGWGGDGRCLEPERKWSLALNPSAPAPGPKDLRVVFDDGADRTYFGLDLDLFAYVVLGDTEAELFEWDPAGRPTR